MSEQQQARSEESLRHEYNEVAQYCRHHSNLRFVVFSIFFAVMGGVGFVAFSKGQFDVNAVVMARIAGVLVIAIFWLYSERITELLNHYVRLRAELEHALHYSSWLPDSGGYFPKMEVIWRGFYFLVMLLWLYGSFAVPFSAGPTGA